MKRQIFNRIVICSFHIGLELFPIKNFRKFSQTDFRNKNLWSYNILFDIFSRDVRFLVMKRSNFLRVIFTVWKLNSRKNLLSDLSKYKNERDWRFHFRCFLLVRSALVYVAKHGFILAGRLTVTDCESKSGSWRAALQQDSRVCESWARSREPHRGSRRGWSCVWRG